MMYLIALAITTYGIVKWKQHNVKRALNLPKRAPHYMDDAYQSAKKVGTFLRYRRYVTGVDLGKQSDATGIPANVLNKIGSGECMEIVYLMRMAHHLGCEVIIREVAAHDTENHERFIELVSRLNDNRMYNRDALPGSV